MKSISLMFLILSSALVYGQESKEPAILSENDWKKEIIKFPVEWAPNVKLEGFEELRFSPFWSNPESDQFWSLVMAWEVGSPVELTEEEVEYNFESYFDGLMKPNHWATTFPRPTVIFISNPEKDDIHSYVGKMKLFDGFHTGKVISQNIKVVQHFDAALNETTLIFRISPKNFDHKIWDELNNISKKTK